MEQKEEKNVRIWLSPCPYATVYYDHFSPWSSQSNHLYITIDVDMMQTFSAQRHMAVLRVGLWFRQHSHCLSGTGKGTGRVSGSHILNQWQSWGLYAGPSNAEPAPYTQRLSPLPKDAVLRILGIFLQNCAQVRFISQTETFSLLPKLFNDALIQTF